MDSIKLYLKESYHELVNKVTWPSYSSLQQNTIAVIIGTLIFTAIIYVLGAAAKAILVDFIYTQF